MSEAKFTKGEWCVIDDRNFGPSYGVQIGRDGGFKFHHEMANAEANAHLIAVAPEMYAMLEKLSGQLTDINAHRAADEVDTLLAKARGEV